VFPKNQTWAVWKFFFNGFKKCRFVCFKNHFGKFYFLSFNIHNYFFSNLAKKVKDRLILLEALHINPNSISLFICNLLPLALPQTHPNKPGSYSERAGDCGNGAGGVMVRC